MEPNTSDRGGRLQETEPFEHKVQAGNIEQGGREQEEADDARCVAIIEQTKNSEVKRQEALSFFIETHNIIGFGPYRE